MDVHPDEATRSGAVDPTAKGGRILLAEDDDEMRALLSTLLRRAGFDVVECRDGSSLVRRYRECCGSDGRAIDLVISDLRMPGSTGFEALAEMATLGTVPPVILITAFGDAPLVEEALGRGVDVVLDKPFDPGILLLRACELVDQSRSTWGRHR